MIAAIRESQMKGIVRSKYGTPEVLQIREIPKPKLGDGELLVKMYASTLIEQIVEFSQVNRL